MPDFSSKDDAWWAEWLAKWDAMQDAYVPHRRDVFRLMAQILADRFPNRCRVADIGAGTGTLAEEILNRVPGSSVLCLDVEPFVLAAAEKRLEPFGDRARVVRVDFRKKDFTTEITEGTERETEEKLEAVVSSTTLHWFGEETLAAIYTWAAKMLIEASSSRPPETGFPLSRLATRAGGPAEGSLGRQGLLRKSGGTLPVCAPKGLDRTAQGQLRPELGEGQSAALGTEVTTNQTIARRASIKGGSQRARQPQVDDQETDDPSPVGAAETSGGLFLNADHIQPDDPELARLALDLNEAERACLFHQTGAVTWDEFWDGLGRDLDQALGQALGASPSGTLGQALGADLDSSPSGTLGQALGASPRAPRVWGEQDGPEAGYPISVHERLLRQAGFRHIAILWRHLSDALLVASRWGTQG